MEAVVRYKSTSEVRRHEDNRGLVSDTSVGFRLRLRLPQSFMPRSGTYTTPQLRRWRRARLIYLADAGTRSWSDFKRPLQRFVARRPLSLPRGFLPEDSALMSATQCLFREAIIITGSWGSQGGKYGPPSPRVFSPFYGFATVSSSSSPKNIKHDLTLQK